VSTLGSRRAVAFEPDELAELRAAFLAEREARIAAEARLVARIAVLEAVRPRDAADAALRQQLPASTRAYSFTSRELLQHATEDADLAGALRQCCLQGEREIGCWLRAHRGSRDGVTIARHGKRWAATWAT
jgi:hypothetical protein